MESCRDKVSYDEWTGIVQDNKAEFRQLFLENLELWKEVENEDFEVPSFEEICMLKSLRDGLMRRKQEKLRKIICELRTQIRTVWQKCWLSEAEKREFAEFESLEFTEKTVEIHKEELAKWQTFYYQNERIFVKIESRKEMWKNLHELQSKEALPDRFRNRGGQLQKDLNKRNDLMKNISRLEEELKSLSNQYFKAQKKQITILGQEIPNFLEIEWKDLKGKSRRKCGEELSPAPKLRSTPIRSPSLSLSPNALKIKP